MYRECSEAGPDRLRALVPERIGVPPMLARVLSTELMITQMQGQPAASQYEVPSSGVAV